MKLDYNPALDLYVLTAPRADAAGLMLEYGLDLSAVASTNREAVLFTPEPYAAAAFGHCATPLARTRLSHILDQIERSWAPSSDRHIDVPEDRELWPFQIASVDYALSRPHALIADEPGLGKCQPLWARVMTPKGWRRIGELSPGDNVCTVYGKSARVLAVYDRGMARVFRVTFSDGAEAFADTHHIWKVRGRSGTGAVEWFHAQTWEMIERLAAGQRLEIPLADPHPGIEGPPPVSAYLVGLLLGDGCLRGNQVSISSADPEIVARCRTIARFYGAELRFKSGVDWRFCRVAALRERLSALGMMGHLAAAKRVPERYLHGNWRVRLHTLQGLMDSDGWCTETGDNAGFGSVSEGLVDDVIALARSLGGVARKSRKPGSWQATLNMPMCPFWLKRKANRWAPFEHYKPRRWIKSIAPHSFEPVRCISVASKDRLYITDDYVVTHNTPIAIAIANEMQASRVLVVCPAAIRHQWCRRIKEWSTMGSSYRLPASVNGNVYAIVSSGRGVDDNAAWTVISWDLVRSAGLWRALAKGKYDLLILDEAHYAKSIEAKRTRAIFGGGRSAAAIPLAECAARVVALTGTPLPNRPREAYTLARGLCWESIDFLSEDAFNERFNPQKTGKSNSGKLWVDERVGRTAELQNRLRGNFMVRHLKREVMTQLQMPIYDLIYVEETAAVKAALEVERLLDIDPENLEGADVEVLGHIAAARKQMGVAMAPQVADYLKMLLDGGEEKLCVFAWHIEVLDILVAALHRYGVVRVDGKDNAAAKDRKVQEFIRDPECRVIIGNVLSLGTGTDGLQAVCTHALLAEADWVSGHNQQCVDRLDRGGQTGQVQADIFVAPGSISEKVLASALRKGQIVHRALDRRAA